MSHQSCLPLNLQFVHMPQFIRSNNLERSSNESQPVLNCTRKQLKAPSIENSLGKHSLMAHRRGIGQNERVAWNRKVTRETRVRLKIYRQHLFRL